MNPRIRRTLAAIELVGGLMGLGIGAYVLPGIAAQNDDVSIAFLMLLLIGPSLPAIAAGLLWWWDLPFGKALSIGVWLLQVPVLSSPTWGYYYNVGIGWRWMVGPDGITNYLFLGTQWNLSIAEKAIGTTVGVNIVALGVAILTLWFSVRAKTPNASAGSAPTPMSNRDDG